MPAGGLRRRLITESIYQHIRSHLTTLGWFNAGRVSFPLTFEAKSTDFEEEIALNSLILEPDDTTDTDIEMGSDLIEQEVVYYLEFFAESDAIAQHMGGDLRDLLAGRLPSIGANSPIIEANDYRNDPPTVFGFLEVEDVRSDRALDRSKPWFKHWISIQFLIRDSYSGLNDD